MNLVGWCVGLLALSAANFVLREFWAVVSDWSAAKLIGLAVRWLSSQEQGARREEWLAEHAERVKRSGHVSGVFFVVGVSISAFRMREHRHIVRRSTNWLTDWLSRLAALFERVFTGMDNFINRVGERNFATLALTIIFSPMEFIWSFSPAVPLDQVVCFRIAAVGTACVGVGHIVCAWRSGRESSNADVSSSDSK